MDDASEQSRACGCGVIVAVFKEQKKVIGLFFDVAFLSVMLLALAKLCVMLSTSMVRLFINQSTSKGMVARQVFRLREAVELGVGAVVEAGNE